MNGLQTCQHKANQSAAMEWELFFMEKSEICKILKEWCLHKLACSTKAKSFSYIWTFSMRFGEFTIIGKECVLENRTQGQELVSTLDYHWGTYNHYHLFSIQEQDSGHYHVEMFLTIMNWQIDYSRAIGNNCKDLYFTGMTIEQQRRDS